MSHIRGMGSANTSCLLKPGDLVRLTEPADDAERAARFVVHEVMGDRLLIRLLCDLPIPPTELVRPQHVELIPSR